MDIIDKPYLLLDGATGSNLFKSGMPVGVCVEKWIIEHSDVVSELQKEYAIAGSDIVYAPTFGANRIKLGAFGLSDKVADYNIALVGITRDAVGSSCLVAGDISSCGKFCEPFGELTFNELYNIYYEQVHALKEGGVDLIAAETIVSLADARATLLAANDVGLPIFVSITLEENGRALMGMDFLSALITLQSMGADAVGLNCSTGPEKMAEYIKAAYPYANVPLIAKPNAGKPGSELSPEEFSLYFKKIISSGARIIGGCCGSTPQHIKALKKLIETDNTLPSKGETEGVVALASESQIFFLNNEDIILSKPILCGPDLADDIIDAEDDCVAVALIDIEAIEDIDNLIEAAPMAHIPLAFRANNEKILNLALANYQGRAIIDRSCEIDNDILISLSKRYGAIIY